MTRVAAPPSRGEQRRRVRRQLLTAVAAVVGPALSLAWPVLPAGWSLLQLPMPLVLVAGAAALSVAVVRWWGLRSARLLPLAGIGLACLVLAGAAATAWPPEGAAVVSSGALLVPAGRGLHLTMLLLAAAVAEGGMLVLVACLALAISRRRTRRAR